MIDIETLYAKLVDLAHRRLVHVRFNEDRTLVMFKYAHQVFYSNLWAQHPELLEARGIVLTIPTADRPPAIAVLPFAKIFNVGENGVTLDPIGRYATYAKRNGFMAALTVNPLNGERLITTTGSFDSHFVGMATEMLTDCSPIVGRTRLYEIIHPDDPHIVPEAPGAYLLAERFHDTGICVPHVQTFVGEYTGDQLLELARTDKSEGFVVYDQYGPTAKLKTRYYKTKKFAMRVKGTRLRLVWDDPDKARLAFTDEEFWPMFAQLRQRMSFEQYDALPEQQRRSVLESLEDDSGQSSPVRPPASP